ncbi:hypothetical protein CEXT_432141 [Caerostris extrusa]|uniref:Uncharacterized protein n=1 Tax=Caerostris extrusa TaxID=172846 RepID=A0AAV4X143_CAEEX|nr:hypothetical protein CEXT_432141 [Caerostris extrusa]
MTTIPPQTTTLSKELRAIAVFVTMGQKRSDASYTEKCIKRKEKTVGWLLSYQHNSSALISKENTGDFFGYIITLLRQSRYLKLPLMSTSDRSSVHFPALF